MSGNQNRTDTAIPQILILGAGFAGLYLTLRLAARLRGRAEITLVDRNNYFLFSPLLHEVMVGMVEMHHAVHPIRRFLRGLPVRFVEAAVEEIDLEAKTVDTSAGSFAYDYLVLGLGSVTNDFGMEQVARYAFPLKTIAEAFRLRNHILTLFERAANTTDPEERRRLLTFVQAGAGLTGLETITELHDFLHESLRKDYPMIRPEEIRLVLIDGLPELQAPSHPTLARRTLRLLQRKGIELRFKTLVKDAGPGWVACRDGAVIPTHTLIWTAGVCASPSIAALPVEKGSQQRVKVLPTLQLPAYPEVLALGDCAYCTDENGRPLPTTAQVANQQAPVAAANLLRLLAGSPPQPFTYRRMGELASLGTANAIAELGPVTVSGFLAWWIWRTIYLAKMPRWADRVHIAADWSMDLFLPRDTSRIEVAPCPACTLTDGGPGCNEPSRATELSTTISRDR